MYNMWLYEQAMLNILVLFFTIMIDNFSGALIISMALMYAYFKVINFVVRRTVGNTNLV